MTGGGNSDKQVDSLENTQTPVSKSIGKRPTTVPEGIEAMNNEIGDVSATKKSKMDNLRIKEKTKRGLVKIGDLK